MALASVPPHPHTLHSTRACRRDLRKSREPCVSLVRILTVDGAGPDDNNKAVIRALNRGSAARPSGKHGFASLASEGDVLREAGGGDERAHIANSCVLDSVL